MRQGRTVVNADALQVYAPWRILTARPTRDEEAAAPHALYGHVPFTTSYSVGHWLRDLAPLLAARPAPIIVGGTGLFFRALTEGLADIPAIPAETRALAEQRLGEMGLSGLAAELDRDTQAQIDLQNPARVLRA
ncbi:MAG: tRNA (adenosine(37)-N6)-dimethylallyltransferase MiaA, partial [Pseudomonadota bacterium]